MELDPRREPQYVQTMPQDQHFHIPVLMEPVLHSLAPCLEKPMARYFDGTFGRGGHFTELKKRFPTIKTVAMDQDLTAFQFGQNKFQSLVQSGDLILIRDNFAQFSKYQLGKFDGMLLDLGVSSPQLDQKDRGFSFYHNGPLDMRMHQDSETTAASIVNHSEPEDLIKIFRELGEIQKPHKVVRAIVQDRTSHPFTSTQQLAGLIERVDGWRKKGYHPATQYFMALRLAVNDELGVIERALPLLAEALNEGGRLAVISFHSLEDRIVKNFMRESSLGYPLQKKVIIPTEAEEEQNPRSRSAKLRVFVKGLPPPKKNKYPKTEDTADSDDLDESPKNPNLEEDC